MKIAVTGSGGFIGRNLMVHLTNFGLDVVGFSSKSEFGVPLDLSDSKEIKSKLSSFDILIHAAWAGSERASREDPSVQDLNIGITRNLVRSLTGSNIKQIIYFGSQAEFSHLDYPWTDESPMSGESKYAFAKRESYELLKNSTLNFAWLRLFSVYGTGDGRDWILPKTLTSLRNDQKITLGACNQLWSLTHVEDVVQAVKRVIETKTCGKLNVSDLTSIPLRNHLLMLQELLGKHDLISFSENHILERHLIRTPGTIESLGWEPKITTTVGFKRMINEQF